MKISQKELRRIIAEEYIKEENLTEYSEEAEKLIKQMLGDEEYDRRRAMEIPKDTRGGDTTAMDLPYSDEERAPIAVSVEDAIYDMVKDASPEEVAELFNMVFAKIQPPEEEVDPESLYVRGAEGRPTVGFKLEELKTLIREVLAESV
jgi:hypothetical protein